MLRIQEPLVSFLRILSGRAGFLIACSILVIAFAGAFTRPLDGALADWRAHTVKRAPTGELVVVEIDSESLRAAQEWPWPRSHFGQAIRNLRGAGAGLIGVDVDFSARSSPQEDEALAEAVGLDPGSIILPTFLQYAGEENTPLAALSADAVLGGVNIPIDADGRVRRYNRGFEHGEHYHASMGSALAGAAYGDTSQFLIDFGIRADHIERLSFHDVLHGAFDPARVRGKVILIGATALELGDEFSTPVGTVMPGVYVHALAYESVVQGRALTHVRGALLLVIALCALVLLWPRSGALDLVKLTVRHAALLSTLLLGPVLIQAAAPVSVDVGLILLAQLICVVMSVSRELKRRADALVHQREAHLEFIAFHDPETSLPNRRAMLGKLTSAVDRESDDVLIAIAVGIDRFPILRAAIGYANANQVVTGLAERLSLAGSVREVYHISTSILGSVLSVKNDAAAREICARCVEELETGIPIAGQDIEVAVRVGAAVSDGDDGNAEMLLERATIALDHARSQNRPYVVFDVAEIADPKVQLALTSDIKKGLARGEFSLVYQAKVSAREGGIVGAEALLRWTHPVHGEISPGRFIGAAEETGAIHPLTRWVLGKAIEDQAVLRRQGIDIGLSVNLSARTLMDGVFCKDAIDTVRAAAANICFEITETAIIENPLMAISAIAAFRGAGIRISIDDYGTGLSSLSYLKQIAADELKLDRSLIVDLKINARDRLILKSTVDLAHSLGMSVVAEGVEDEGTLAVVSSMGCDYVQGFLTSRPSPIDQFIRGCSANAATNNAGNWTRIADGIALRARHATPR